MTTLPKAIQREVDAANQLQQAVLTPLEDTVVEVVAENPAPPPAESVQPPATPPAPPAPPQPPAVDWEQKFKSLQGLFAQRTSELTAQNKQYESQLNALQRQVQELAQARVEPPKAEKPQADPKDVENFGADMVEMVQRYAENVFRAMSSQFSGKAAALEARIAEVEKTVNGVSQKADDTLERQYWDGLKQAVPDWEQINEDPRWLAWLGEVDPVYGVPRQMALDNAQKALNVRQTAAVFNAFKATLPAPARAESLATQVAPSSAAPVAQAPAPAAPKIYSAKAVEKFYKDFALGKYQGREAEAERLMAEIDRAAAEGRIR